MLSIKVDEAEVRKMYHEELRRHIQKVESELLFWDTDDLMKQTRLSWNTIQSEFFHDPRFPKSKLGRKWLFPVQKTKEFLLEWLEEHRYNPPV
ncbi:group-specific protein [Bacillus infantis]|uniref:group-specific protein n=1 Tax=Bacillus infantis TaxID=324767 RepID=UPI00101DE1E9|nr:group-specific protein [Bacillus infantis]RYI30452.1 group-specific protein [Bacillus infantis]